MEKVLFVCPDYSLGGFTTFTLNMAAELSRRGYECAALVLHRRGACKSQFYQSLPGTTLCQREMESRLSYLQRLSNTIEQQNARILLLNGVPCVQALLPSLRVDALRISVVHSPNNLEVSEGTENLKYLNAVVGVSRGIVEAIRKLRGQTGVVREIPVGVNIGPAAKEGRSGQPIALLYVGRLTRCAKNLRRLIEIAEHLMAMQTPFRLTVVGDGEARLELERAANARFPPSVVKFTGLLSRQDVRRQMQLHDVLLLTSEYEGTPHVVLEAMAEGTIPVVSAIEGSTDRILSHGKTGFLCNTGGPSEFVDCIQKLAACPQMRHYISQEARNSVARDFSITHIVDEYIRLFTETATELPPEVPLKDLLASARVNRLVPSPVRHLRARVGECYRGLLRRQA